MISFEFSRRRIRSLSIAALLLAALLPIPAARAQFAVQVQSAASPDSEVPLQFSGNTDSVPSSGGYHIFPANTEAGKHAALTGLAGLSDARGATVKPLAGLPKPGFFPADLTNLGGLVLLSGGSVNIYYNCANESCWGDPEGFLSNLAVSRFIHVVDQYIGLKTNKRYPLTATGTTSGSTTFASASQIQAIVHSAAQQVGPHVFHVFLPQGVDTCADAGNSICYSPDNPSTFVFCAYHSSVSFSDFNQPLVYTVEPFQNVTGCFLTPPNPNSAMIDSTNSALSHELFELITDPLPGSNPAWVAVNSQLEQGSEIGDICHGPGDGFGGTIVPSYVLINGHSRITYQTQLEYSNLRHGCVVTP